MKHLIKIKRKLVILINTIITTTYFTSQILFVNLIGLIRKYLFFLCNFNICFNCYQVIIGKGLCVKCWKQLKFTPYNSCGICGLNGKVTCYNCNLDSRNIFSYNSILSNLILQFKYGKKHYLSDFFVKFMGSLYIPYKNLVILYIPHFFGKQITTSVNSSLLLAYAFKSKFGGTIAHNILKKINKRRQKDACNYKERAENSLESYKINMQYINLVKNKNIILIDDIITTGSTITTCGNLIKKCYPNSLQILTVGKVF
jgi:competence protein ComFC